MSQQKTEVHFKAVKLASEHPSETGQQEIMQSYSWNNRADKLINNPKLEANESTKNKRICRMECEVLPAAGLFHRKYVDTFIL